MVEIEKGKIVRRRVMYRPDLQENRPVRIAEEIGDIASTRQARRAAFARSAARDFAREQTASTVQSWQRITGQAEHILEEE